MSLGEAGRDPRSISSLCLKADAAPPCTFENSGTVVTGDIGEKVADPGVGEDMGELNAFRSGDILSSEAGDIAC